MIRIVELNSVRVEERFLCFIKGHIMGLQVRFCFSVVPVEFHRDHYYNVTSIF